MPAKQPTFFIPHGAGPCFFMEWDPPDAWDRMAAFLRAIGTTLAQPPRAIVLVSAHWLAAEFTAGAAAQPDLIYDYYNFPPHTYELTYPAPGQPALAQQVVERLQQAGLPGATDPVRGFDHGTFIPLKLIFPQAQIPVVQLSLRRDLEATAHLEAGRALQPLRQEGVLIIGSGMSFHNMRGYGDPRFGPISDRFDDWLTRAVELDPAARWQALAHWEQAPGARACHPEGQEEHLLPLLLAAGAAGEERGQRVFTDRVMGTRLSGYRFG